MTGVTFTRKCTGDLGLVVDDVVVSLLFFRRGSKTFFVYDVINGGEGVEFEILINALAHMEKLGREFELQI